MDKQIGNLFNKIRGAVQTNDDDGNNNMQQNEQLIVEASRVFISKIDNNLTSEDVLKYFQVLKVCKMTNSNIQKLKKDNFVSELNSRLKVFIKSSQHELDFHTSQILCQTIVLLIRKSLKVSSYLHQSLQSEGVWHTFAMLINTCPVENMPSLLNYVKEAAILLQNEYLDNMDYDSQIQCLGTYLLLMDMARVDVNNNNNNKGKNNNSRSKHERDEMRLAILQSVLSVYGNSQEICLGVEPRLNLIKNFVQLLLEIEHEELNVMIFKSIEILATGYSYTPKEAVKEAANVIVEIFQNISSGSNKHNLKDALKLLKSFASLVGHLVEYDNNYYDMLIEINIVSSFIYPLMDITWKENTSNSEDDDDNNINNNNDNEFDMKNFVNEIIENIVNETINMKTNVIDVENNMHEKNSLIDESFYKLFYEGIFYLLTQFATRNNVLLDKLLSPTCCNLYRGSLSHHFKTFMIRKKKEPINKIIDVSPYTIGPCLMFLEKLVVQSSKHLETVLTMLLQIVQDMQLSSKAFAINILETISYMISTARRGRNIFCQVYGFETCLSLFTRFLGDFTNNYNDNDNNTIQDKEGKSLFFTSLIVKILQTFTVAMDGPHTSNRRHFNENINYHSILEPLRLSNILKSNFGKDIINALLYMLSGDSSFQRINNRNIHVSSNDDANIFKINNWDSNNNNDNNSNENNNVNETSLKQINNSILEYSKMAMSMNYSVLFIIFNAIIHISPKEDAMKLLQQIRKILTLTGPLARESASIAGSVAWAMEALDGVKDVDLIKELVNLIGLVAKHGTTPYEIRHVLKLVQNSDEKPILSKLMLSLLKDMSALSYAPFVTFGKDPSKDDLPAYGKISNFGEWTWPPKEGMSVSCWIRIVNDHGINSPDKSKETICLINVYDSQNNTIFAVHLGREDITFVNGTASSQEIAYFRHDSSMFKDHDWHHILITHQRERKSRMNAFWKSNEGTVIVYIDGVQCKSDESSLPFSTSGVKNGKLGVLSGIIGSENKSLTQRYWHLGPTIVSLEPFSQESVLRIYLAGPNQISCFRGATVYPSPLGVYVNLLQKIGRNEKSTEEVLTVLGLYNKNSADTLAKIKAIQEIVLNPDAIVLFYVASETKKVDMAFASGANVKQNFMVSNMAIDSYGIRSRRGIFQLKGGAFPNRPHALCTWLRSVEGVISLFPLIDKTLVYSDSSIDHDTNKELFLHTLSLVVNMSSSDCCADSISELEASNGYAILAYFLAQGSELGYINTQVMNLLFQLCAGPKDTNNKNRIAANIDCIRLILFNTIIFTNSPIYSSLRVSILRFILGLVQKENALNNLKQNDEFLNLNASYNVLRLLEADGIKWLLHTSLRDAHTIASLIDNDKQNGNSNGKDINNLLDSYDIVEDILYELLRARGEINDLFYIAEFLISSVHTNMAHISFPYSGTGVLHQHRENLSIGYERYQNILLNILLKMVHGDTMTKEPLKVAHSTDANDAERKSPSIESSILSTLSSMQSMMPPAPSLSSTSNSRSSSGDTKNKKRNKKHAEDTTKRLYTIYEQVFFEQYNMWFLCLMDRAESTEVISLAFRLFIEILQNTESNTQERHIQFMLLQFEYALTQHCHSFDIYILLIAFLVGVPVKMLPQNMFESKSAVDVTSILNQFKAASAATETSINILKDEDANAIMSMISNLLREHLRKATFPEYNKAYGGSPKRTVFHRRGGSTDSGYYGENDEETTTDDDDQNQRNTDILNEDTNRFNNQNGENEIASMMAHIFLSLMEEDDKFKSRCASASFMRHIVKFIFSCASQNDASVMRANSNGKIFSIKIIEQYVDDAREDISVTEGEDNVENDTTRTKRTSLRLSSRGSEISAYENVFSGRIADTLFELIGQVTEAYILGDVSSNGEKTMSIGLGTRVCLMILDAFPSYAPQHLIRAYQLRTLRVLHSKLGQTLSSLRFDWLHNDFFIPQLQQLCEEIVKKAMYGWFEGCEHVILLFLFDCLQCAQKLSNVQKLDVKRRKNMVQSISSSVYAFICFTLQQYSDDFEGENICKTLKLISENSQFLNLVNVNQRKLSDAERSNTISGIYVGRSRGSSKASSTIVSGTSPSTFQKFMSTDSMFVNSSFSHKDFLHCFCYLSYKILELDCAESRELVKIWKDMFKFNHFEMIELIGSSTASPKQNSTNKRRKSEMAQRDLYAEGFHLLVEDAKDELFLEWIRRLKNHEDLILRDIITKTTAKAWKKRERQLSSPKVPFERLVEILRLEESREGPSKKVVRKSVTLSDAPAICQSTVYELCKSVNKTCTDEWKRWEQVILMGQSSWKSRTDNDYRAQLVDNDNSPSSTANKWQLDESEAFLRMRRRVKPNPGFFETYGLKKEITLWKDRALSPSSMGGNNAFETPMKATNGSSKKEGELEVPIPVTSRRLSAKTLLQRADAANNNVGTPFTSGVNVVSAVPRVARRMNSTPLDEAEDDLLDTLTDGGEIQVQDENKNSKTGNIRSILNKLDLSKVLIANDVEIKFVSNCTVVRGLEAIEAIFVVTETDLLIVEGYQLADDGSTLIEIQKTEVKWDYTIELLPNPDNNNNNKNKVEGSPSPGISTSNNDSEKEKKLTIKTPRAKTSRERSTVDTKHSQHSRHCISYENVKAFYKRRYLLRRVGIELFSGDGESIFIAMRDPKVQAKVYKIISSLNFPNSIFKEKNKSSNANDTTSAPQVGSSSKHRKYLNFTTKKWLEGDISNFEYLMILNTMAGRSYNDLTQYPVFPWVLADYHSKKIDLNLRSSYRDLSKPMGALGEKRAKEFRSRYQEVKSLEDPMTPPFHYGTHYSTSAYILYYFVRMEPFSQMSIDLQNGKFDHPSRLFTSINRSWIAASGGNPADSSSLQDVRELTPEFFYSAEFLKNSNNFNFGEIKPGSKINDVELPPWCNNDPGQFVRINRKALESKYVSENLHHWIDLIFGYKQIGQEAENAQNVFHPFTYEGEVDVDAIEDDAMRESVMAQIHNFGQTPTQLFKSPHPRREVKNVSLHDEPKQVLSLMRWHRYLSGPLVLPGIYPPRIVLEASEMVEETLLQKATKVIEMYLSNSINLGPVSDIQILPNGNVERIRSPVVGSAMLNTRNRHNNSNRSGGTTYGAILHPPTFRKYLAWGHPDGSVQVHTYVATPLHRDVGRIVTTHDGLHIGPVTCAVFSNDGQLLVTGGYDAIIGLWSVSKNDKKRKALKGSERILKLKGRLCGHNRPITCVSISTLNGIIVSGSEDCSIIVWDITEMVMVRVLLGHEKAILSVSINERSGNIITGTDFALRVWNINGSLMACVNMLQVRLSPLSYILASDSEDWQNCVNVVTGHEDGKIVLWQLVGNHDDLITEFTETEILPQQHTPPEPSSIASLSSQRSNSYSFHDLLAAEEEERAVAELPVIRRVAKAKKQRKVSIVRVRSMLTLEILKKNDDDNDDDVQEVEGDNEEKRSNNGEQNDDMDSKHNDDNNNSKSGGQKNSRSSIHKSVVPPMKLHIMSIYKKHQARITAMALSFDGTKLATGCAHGKVYIWKSLLDKKIDEYEIIKDFDDLM